VIKFILYVTMCIGGECANLTSVYNSAYACQAGATDMITIMQRNKVENFVIVCEKKRSI
tara:strand:+ start:560 stop:736 length:177 start_codon:yes stop_codon:yes gene_type:complete